MTALNNLRTGLLRKTVSNSPIISFCYVAIWISIYLLYFYDRFCIILLIFLL